MIDRKGHVLVPLSTLSLLGIVLLLFSTRWGVGLSPDSVAYIAAARDLLSGHDYTTIHWPPLFPVSLATIGLFRVDPLVGARGLNAMLFAANIALVGTIVSRYTRGSLLLSFLAAFLMLTSADMITIHSMAWSEPLFIFLGFLGILLLADYLERQHLVSLLASAGAIALAFLTRYPGAALVASGVIGISLLSKKGYRKRIVDVGVFIAISAFPMALWMLRNAYVLGNATDRVIAFHPITLRNVLRGLVTFASWLIPIRRPGGVLLLLVLGTGLLVASVTGVVMWRKCRARGEDNPAGQDLASLPTLLGIFVACYLGLVIVAASFVERGLLLEERSQSPVFVAVLILVFCTTHKRSESREASQFLRFCLIVLFAGLAGSYLVRGAVYVIQSHREGIGYASKAWLQSETIRAVKTLPSGVQIYSNGPDAIYILTGRPATLFPVKIDPTSGVGNKKYLDQLFEMEKRSQQCKSILVNFDAIKRWYLPGADELEREMSPAAVRKTDDGAIYDSPECH